MTPRWRSALTGSEVYEGDARIVAQAQGLPTQTTGQADLFGGGQ